MNKTKLLNPLNDRLPKYEQQINHLNKNTEKDQLCSPYGVSKGH